MRKLLLLAFLLSLTWILSLPACRATGGDDDDSGEDDTEPEDDTETFDDTEPEDDTQTIDDDSVPVDDAVDCDDDTDVQWIWTDPDTGLIWQDGPTVGCNGGSNWYSTYQCDIMEWNGYDDWRMPTVSELRSLIRGCENTVSGGICGVTDECLLSSCSWDCETCDYLAGLCYWPSDVSGICSPYWTSSPVTDFTDDDTFELEAFWYIDFGDGGIKNSYDVGADINLRCLRDAM